MVGAFLDDTFCAIAAEAQEYMWLKEVLVVLRRVHTCSRESRLRIRSCRTPRRYLLAGFPALGRRRLPGGTGRGILAESGNVPSFSPETRGCKGGDRGG